VDPTTPDPTQSKVPFPRLSFFPSIPPASYIFTRDNCAARIRIS